MLRVYIPQPGFTPYSYDEPKGLWVNDMETGFRYSSNYSGRFFRADFDTSIFTDYSVISNVSFKNNLKGN